jgi:hypothetical protein
LNKRKRSDGDKNVKLSRPRTPAQTKRIPLRKDILDGLFFVWFGFLVGKGPRRNRSRATLSGETELKEWRGGRKMKKASQLEFREEEKQRNK